MEFDPALRAKIEPSEVRRKKEGILLNPSDRINLILRKEINMKPNLYIVTLAVDDLARALAFYQDGIGLGRSTHGGDHILFELQGELTLVLFLRSEFNKFAGQDNDSRTNSSISLSYQAENKQEVDDLLQKAVHAGGTIPSQPQTYNWGYHGYFKDPDGHLWEIVTFFE